MLEFDDDEARLLYAVVPEKRRYTSGYTNASEVANRLWMGGGGNTDVARARRC